MYARIVAPSRTILPCVLLLAMGACSDTTDPPKSTGNRSDAGSENEPKDSGSDFVFDDGSGSGTTWTSLYADFFGPSGRASCAGTGSDCHASSDAAGAKSMKFVCASKDGCLASMLGDSRLVQESHFSAPESAYLVAVLRKEASDGSIRGTQPKSPPFVFHEKSIERITTWIGNGAKDD